LVAGLLSVLTIAGDPLAFLALDWRYRWARLHEIWVTWQRYVLTVKRLRSGIVRSRRVVC